jgi:hypothetical protein
MTSSDKYCHKDTCLLGDYTVCHWLTVPVGPEDHLCFLLQGKVLQDEQPHGERGYIMYVMLKRLDYGGDRHWEGPWTCLGCWE